MAINIITYSGKVRTAKHDAIVYDAALDRSGILNGCNVTVNGDILTVALGYGIIKGRVFEVTEESFRVEFPSSGTKVGGLAVTLDLGNPSNLLSMGVVSADSELELDKDNSANFNNGRYQMLIAKYTLTTSAVTNLVQAAHLIPQDSMGYTDFNDFTEPGVYYWQTGLDTFSNKPTFPEGSGIPGINNGWLVVYDDKRNGTYSGAIKQIYLRHGSANTHHHIFVRTRTGGNWNSWVRVMTELDLYTLDHALTINTTTVRPVTNEARFAMVTNYRNTGLFTSGAKNFGLYDFATNGGEWILQSNGTTGDVTIPHKLIVDSFNPDLVVVGKSTETENRRVNVTNYYRHIALIVNTAQNAGIYDDGNSEWIIRSANGGDVYVPNHLHAGSNASQGGDSSAAYYLNTTTRNGSILVSDAGNFGLYDNDSNNWVICSTSNKTVTVPHPMSVTGQFTAPKSFVTGKVTITPSSANTPKSADVTWPAMSAVPIVVATPNTTVVGTTVKGVAVSDITTTGCKIWVTRGDTTATVVNYIAMCV